MQNCSAFSETFDPSNDYQTKNAQGWPAIAGTPPIAQIEALPQPFIRSLSALAAVNLTLLLAAI